jgi:hypothetical protein
MKKTKSNSNLILELENTLGPMLVILLRRLNLSAWILVLASDYKKPIGKKLKPDDVFHRAFILNDYASLP